MSRLISRRVRSRDQESGSTNSRILGTDAVTREKTKNRSMTEIKQWPGTRPVRSKDLDPSTVQDLDDRFVTGAFQRIAVGSQTWSGALTLGSQSDAVGWPTVGTFPKDGYYDLHVDLPVTTPAEVSWELKVDGTTVTSGTTWAAGTLSGVVPTGQVDQDSTWELHADGLEVGAGELVVQLVDRAQAESKVTLGSPTVIGTSEDDTDTSDGNVSLTAPSGVTAGDMLIAVGLITRADWVSVPAGLTTLIDFDAVAGVNNSTIEARAWHWTADSDDESQATTYTWESAGQTSVMIVALSPGSFGTFGTAVHDSVKDDTGNPFSLSVTAPAGDWVLTIAAATRNKSTAPTGDYDFEFDSPVVSLAAYGRAEGASRRNGRFEVGSGSEGDTVSVTFPANNTNGFVGAVGVS